MFLFQFISLSCTSLMVAFSVSEMEISLCSVISFCASVVTSKALVTELNTLFFFSSPLFWYVNKNIELKLQIWTSQHSCSLFCEDEKQELPKPCSNYCHHCPNEGLWCWDSTVGKGEKGQGRSWFAPFRFQMVPCQCTCHHHVAAAEARVPPWLHPPLASCRQTYCTAILASSSQHGFHKSTRRLSC